MICFDRSGTALSSVGELCFASKSHFLANSVAHNAQSITIEGERKFVCAATELMPTGNGHGHTAYIADRAARHARLRLERTTPTRRLARTNESALAPILAARSWRELRARTVVGGQSRLRQLPLRLRPRAEAFLQLGTLSIAFNLIAEFTMTFAMNERVGRRRTALDRVGLTSRWRVASWINESQSVRPERLRILARPRSDGFSFESV